jgi:hypothetical protein
MKIQMASLDDNLSGNNSWQQSPIMSYRGHPIEDNLCIPVFDKPSGKNLDDNILLYQF